MKKFCVPLAVIFLSLFLLSPAHADVIFTPNNSFYDTHSEDCTYLNRSFYANGKDGYVDFKTSPTGSVTQRFENGTLLHISWQYQNWGVVSLHDGKTFTDGWVCLDDLALQYDHISFAQEYGDQFTSYNGEFSNFNIPIDSLNFFSYPGAPSVEVSIDLTKSRSILSCLIGTEETPSYISTLFVDENGLTWGYVAYVQGIRNVWFCLDDPSGADFPPRTATPELIPASTPPAVHGSYLPYLLTGGVVIITAAVLFFIRHRSKGAKKDSSAS